MSIQSGSPDDTIPLGEIHGVPVGLSPWFFLVGLFVVYSSSDIRQGAGFVLVYGVSVLVHELGHAVVADRYHLMPQVVISGFGGWTAHQPAPTREAALKLTAAGPGAGLLLGLISAVAWMALPETAPPGLVELLSLLTWMNLFWSVFNLIPILPMDGGRLLELGLSGRMGMASARRYALYSSVGFGIALALMALWMGFIFGALFLGWFAWQAIAELKTSRAPFERWDPRGVEEERHLLRKLAGQPAAASLLLLLLGVTMELLGSQLTSASPWQPILPDREVMAASTALACAATPMWLWRLLPGREMPALTAAVTALVAQLQAAILAGLYMAWWGLPSLLMVDPVVADLGPLSVAVFVTLVTLSQRLLYIGATMALAGLLMPPILAALPPVPRVAGFGSILASLAVLGWVGWEPPSHLNQPQRNPLEAMGYSLGNASWDALRGGHDWAYPRLVSDRDGDGLVDLVVRSGNGDLVLQSPNWTVAEALADPLPLPEELALNADLAWGEALDQVTWAPDGPGTSVIRIESPGQVACTLTVSCDPGGLTVGDLDGNGRKDLFASCAGGEGAWLLWGQVLGCPRGMQ